MYTPISVVISWCFPPLYFPHPSLLLFLPLTESQVISLEEVQKTKDMEIEKYKKYLNKAKKIIESFGEGKSRAAEDSLEVCHCGQTVAFSRGH